MQKRDTSPTNLPDRNSGKNREHHRVAARLKAVVKNLGTKKNKKQPK